MTTSTHDAVAARPHGAFDRLVHWVLDLDGGIYGDERERLRWYEAIALAASFQWILVPWTLALAVWFVPDAAVWALVAVMVAFYLPMPLVTAYISRRRVRPVPVRSRKYVAVAVLTGLPYAIFGIGALVAGGAFDDPDPDEVWSTIAGAVVGGTVGLLAAYVGLRLLRRRHEAVGGDGD